MWDVATSKTMMCSTLLAVADEREKHVIISDNQNICATYSTQNFLYHILLGLRSAVVAAELVEDVSFKVDTSMPSFIWCAAAGEIP